MVWQLEMPKTPGKYWTRTFDGEEAGILTVCFHESIGTYCSEYPTRKRNGYSGAITEGTTWGGWWWSEPLTVIPPWPNTDERTKDDQNLLYAVTLISKQCGGHAVAICQSLERAKSIVESNEGDLWETIHDLAVIETLVADACYGGFHRYYEQQCWYAWSITDGRYLPIDRPSQFDKIVGIGVG